MNCSFDCYTIIEMCYIILGQILLKNLKVGYLKSEEIVLGI